MDSIKNVMFVEKHYKGKQQEIVEKSVVPNLYFDFSIFLPESKVVKKDDTNFDLIDWRCSVWGCKWLPFYVYIYKYTDTDVELTYETANSPNDEWVKTLIDYAFHKYMLSKSDNFSVKFDWCIWTTDEAGAIETIWNNEKRSVQTTTCNYMEYLEDYYPEAYKKYMEESEIVKKIE